MRRVRLELDTFASHMFSRVIDLDTNCEINDVTRLTLEIDGESEETRLLLCRIGKREERVALEETAMRAIDA